MTQPQKSKRGAVRAAVLTFFEKNPGMAIYVEDLVKDTGYTRTQIQASIYNLIKSGLYDLTSEAHGQIWRYRGLKRESPRYSEENKRSNGRRLFEEVGSTKKGTIVIQDEKGNLFEANEL